MQQAMDAVRWRAIDGRTAGQEQRPLAQVVQQVAGLRFVGQVPQGGRHLGIEHSILGQNAQPGKGSPLFGGQRAQAERQRGLQAAFHAQGPHVQLLRFGGIQHGLAGRLRLQRLAQLEPIQAIGQVGSRQLEGQRQAAKQARHFEGLLALCTLQRVRQAPPQQLQGLRLGHRL